MAYELKTVKVELNGSKGFLGPFKKADYAVFYQELLHGTQRAVNAISRPHLTYPEGSRPTLVVEGEDLKVEGAKTVDIDLIAVDWDAVNDVIIIRQVKEWSFGPVTQETLDGLPKTVRDGLVNEANRLYAKQRPLARGGGVS